MVKKFDMDLKTTEAYNKMKKSLLEFYGKDRLTDFTYNANHESIEFVHNTSMVQVEPNLHRKYKIKVLLSVTLDISGEWTMEDILFIKFMSPKEDLNIAVLHEYVFPALRHGKEALKDD